MSSGSFKNIIYKMWEELIYLIYMYKKDLALNNCYGTVTYPFMDSSKFYINREPSTLEKIGYGVTVV